MTLRDLLREVSRSISERAGRSVLASLGATLGIGTIVAVFGLSATASNQISLRFDALRSSVVYLEPTSPQDDETMRMANLRTLDTVGGVASVARTTVLHPRDASMRPIDGRAVSITPVVADGDFASALELIVLQGRFWDTPGLVPDGPVAVLGQTVAKELGLPPFTGPFTLWVEGRPVTVTGFVGAGAIDPRSDSWVFTPRANFDPTIWGSIGDTTVVIRVVPGAGSAVAKVATVALDPESPASFVALAPPEPEVLRSRVEDDTRLAFLIAAGVALVVGGLAIGAIMMTSVVERTEQFGIRRALGATRNEIVRLVLSESLVLGLLGGAAGCMVGLVAILGFSIALDWQPVLDMQLLPLAVALGAFVGGVAGLGPAIHAGRVDPIRAMRRL